MFLQRPFFLLLYQMKYRRPRVVSHVDERPNLVRLDRLARQIDERGVLVGRARLAHISRQLRHGVDRYARHAARRAGLSAGSTISLPSWFASFGRMRERSGMGPHSALSG